jgi:hypothetical protein
MSLCQYKDIFGIPGTGIHSTRFFGLAFYDILFTVIGAVVLSKYYYTEFTWYYILGILLIIGKLFHLLFCVKTPITNLITG